MTRLNQSINPIAPARFITTSELSALRLIPQIQSMVGKKIDGDGSIDMTTNRPSKKKPWDTEGDK
ncbi:hypothetical protein HOO68_02045 [Candidatus Gracilibacteria bacterium]|nr:hypothetical protein [Candidatus Gracilibacteria bacterium]